MMPRALCCVLHDLWAPLDGLIQKNLIERSNKLYETPAPV
jgi:hypothetical protein